MLSLIGLSLYLIVEILRPEVILPESIAEYVMTVLAVVMAVAWIVESSARPWVGVPSTRFLIALLMIATVSTAFVIDSTHPFSGFLELIKLALAYLIAVQSIRSPGRLKMMQWVFTSLIILLAVKGVLFSLGYPMAGFSGDRQVRLQYSGIFADSNDLGQLYAVGWTLVFYDFINGKKPMLRFLEAPVLVFLTAGIFYCESRGAILGILLGFVLTVRKKTGVVLPLCAAFLMFVVMNIAGIGRMNLVSTGENSAETRIKSWAQGWYMLRSHPLLGVGPKKFRDHHPTAAHSSLVQVGAETGIFGFFCWVGFYFFAIRESVLNVFSGAKTKFRPRSQLEEPSSRTLQLQASLIVCFFTGLFLSRAYVLYPYFLTAMALSARNIDLYKNLDKPFKALPRVHITGREFAQVGVAFAVCLLFWRFMIRHYIVGP